MEALGKPHAAHAKLLNNLNNYVIHSLTQVVIRKLCKGSFNLFSCTSDCIFGNTFFVFLVELFFPAED